MKRIQIKKNDIVTNQIEALEVDADAWLEKHIAMGTFGKAAYSYEQDVPAVYEDGAEILDENEQSFDPPQYEQVLVTEATTETVNVPAEYEVVEEDISDEYTKKLLVEDKQGKGAKAREACVAVLDMIAGFNLDRELTIEQITQMQTTFANAEAALKANRPTYAKSYINAITPDEVLVTQEMKDLCIELLADY